jgi:rhamnosyltransferase subunit B
VPNPWNKVHPRETNEFSPVFEPNMTEEPPSPNPNQAKPHISAPAPPPWISNTKRALLTWELGEGLGHVSQLLAVARGLKAEGWEVVFSGREPHSLLDEVKKVADRIVPCPFLNPVKSVAKFRASTFADILAQYGFSRAETLHAVLSSLDGLLHYVRPSVIIGDYAPFIALAAFRRIPMIAIGASFCNPPAQLPRFPPFNEGPGFGMSEEQLLGIVREVQRRRGQPEPRSLPEAVGGDAQFVLSLPEFDLYAKLRQTQACGPASELLEPLPPSLGDRKLFVYLNYHFPPTRNLLRLLSQAPLPVFGFIRDSPADFRRQLREHGIQVSDKPLPIAQALAECWGIVHHAGAGTLHEAASAGRPQLLFPIHAEQSINATLAAQAGIAKIIKPKSPPEEWHQGVTDFVATESLAVKARRIAGLIHKRMPFRGVEAIVNHARELVLGRW